MSAAPAPAAAAPGEAPAKGGKKKLIIIIVAVLVLLGGAGGGFMFLQHKKAAEAAAAEEGGEEADGGHGSKAKGKEAKRPEKDAKAAAPPAFVALEPFTVNLSDKDTDRFAQVGLSLQIEDPKVADEIKAYMPAIRNAVLMILSHKTSQELLSTEGKEKMADEIRRETARAMGYEVEDPEEESVEEEAPKKKKKKRRAPLYNPIVQVHYSNFIVQ